MNSVAQPVCRRRGTSLMARVISKDAPIPSVTIQISLDAESSTIRKPARAQLPALFACSLVD